MIAHDELLTLVVRVNGALALVSWPFALYEVFAKNPGIPELQDKVELLRTQLLGSVALDLAEKLRPFWPRAASRIIVEPSYEADPSTSLSDEAIDEMKGCLESHETTLRSAIQLRHVCARGLAFHHWCYWSIFATAVESMIALIVWFSYSSMPDGLARTLLGVPILTAALALLCAAVRQAVIHSVERAIVSRENIR